MLIWRPLQLFIIRPGHTVKSQLNQSLFFLLWAKPTQMFSSMKRTKIILISNYYTQKQCGNLTSRGNIIISMSPLVGTLKRCWYTDRWNLNPIGRNWEVFLPLQTIFNTLGNTDSLQVTLCIFELYVTLQCKTKRWGREQVAQGKITRRSSHDVCP